MNKKNCGRKRNARTGFTRTIYAERQTASRREECYNAKRKAKMEAAMAAIRAEDMEKGIFTTVSQLPK